MPSATQLSLFSGDFSCRDPGPPAREESQHLLKVFRRARHAERAHSRSIEREVSQLRSLARDAGLCGETSAVSVLASDMEMVARLLLDPVRPIARATARARLVAVQRFVVVVSPILGLDAAAQLAELDRLLPSTRSSGWHDAGTMVAGEVGRRRHLRPTLDPVDLERIVEMAGMPETKTHTQRNRALVALTCFSGLRPEEIVALRWEHLSLELAGTAQSGLTINVARRGGQVRIPVPAIATRNLAALALSLESELDRLSGPVFRARSRTGRPLGYRTIRAVVCDACRQAGFPGTEAADLRSAFGWWLKAKGLSDHEVAEVLGLARVRSVDRLLRRHMELQAQRRVREILDRSS